MENLAGGLPAKQPLTGEHFVEDRAQIEEVGTMVHHSAAKLLGRHVAGSAEKVQVPFRFEVAASYAAFSGCARPILRRAYELGQTEVENLDPAVASKEQVLGF